MTTIKAGAVRFKLYPEDHLPRHAHGLYAGIEVVVQLGAERTVTLASRNDAIQPKDAKRSDVRKILNAAATHFDALVDAWEKMHQ